MTHLLAGKGNKKQTFHDAYIKENVGIDAAILAENLHVTERFVVRRQRKLGIRLCLNTPRKGESHDGTNRLPASGTTRGDGVGNLLLLPNPLHGGQKGSSP